MKMFASIQKSIRSGKFLPTAGNNDIINNFTAGGTDSNELYQKNLKTQSNDWEYRTKPVNYTLNKHHYRTEQFADIDWAESVVIFGCSAVFGVGVDDADTVSSHLSSILNRPVINMGVGGSSITYSLHNSIILNANYPTPKAVVHLWTGYDRTVYYHRKDLTFYGPWNVTPSNYIGRWTESKEHGEIHALFARLTSKQLWEDIEYYEASYFQETAKVMRCDDLGSPRPNVSDKGRDNIHPGRQTIRLVAERIAGNLDV